MSEVKKGPDRLHQVGHALETRVLDDACTHDFASSGRHLLSDVAKLCIAMAAVRVLVDAPAHEMGHWVAASVLGFPWDFLHHEFVAGPNTVVSATAIALIDTAGGLFSGLVLSALAIVVPRPYRNGIVPLAAAEFAYAPFDPHVLGDAIAVAVFFVALGAIAFVYVRHYWAAKDEPTIVEDSVGEAARLGRFLRCLGRFEASLDGRVLSPSGVQ